ncbi:uncharacterized protein LOC142352946 [Convolutriloba macropyga]|uniref:uncharacterized protein LOC142352946 n=1 Tax=Convolutriloba macropyga TaxID=536237 RepID=UPI003F51E43D
MRKRKPDERATICSGPVFVTGYNVSFRCSNSLMFLARSSPQYSKAPKYEHNLDCYWMIEANPGTSLLVTVNEFKVERSTECANDYLRVIEYSSSSSSGSTGVAVYDEIFCASEIFRSNVFYSPVLFLHFHTDAAVAKVGFQIQITTDTPSDGDLRLEGLSPRNGLVLMFFDNTWKAICVSTLDLQLESQLICQDLGFTSPSQSAIAASTDSTVYDVTRYDAWNFGVSCSESDGDFNSCIDRRVSSVQCTNDQYAWINCGAAHEDSTLRLVETARSDNMEFIGRVEVYYGGAWGTVCDDSFDMNDANVVCKTLGYVNGALYYYTAGETDPGSGLVMMDNLACTGAETSLGECEFNGWTVSNCFHTEDVGVACRANDLNVFDVCLPDTDRGDRTISCQSSSIPSDDSDSSSLEDLVIYPVYSRYGFFESSNCTDSEIANCESTSIISNVFEQCYGKEQCIIDPTGFQDPCSHVNSKLKRTLEVLYNCTSAFCPAPFFEDSGKCFYIGLVESQGEEVPPADYPDQRTTGVSKSQSEALCSQLSGSTLIATEGIDASAVRLDKIMAWMNSLGASTFTDDSEANETANETTAECLFVSVTAGEPLYEVCTDVTAAAFVCELERYSVLSDTKSWSEWTEWTTCESNCEGESGYRVRTRQCENSPCDGSVVEAENCNPFPPKTCTIFGQVVEEIVFIEAANFTGIKIESDLYTNTQSTSYKYLQYRIQSLVRAIIDETGSFVDYSNVTIVPGLLIITATIIYSDPDQMANFRNSLERIIETSGPFALGPDAVWDFRQDNNTIEISPGDVPREGFEGVVPGRRRRNTQSEEEAWNWLTEYIVKPHSDASSGSVSDVFLPQFEDLEPFDWKGAIDASVEDDYSDFKRLALFDESVVENYGHQLKDFIVQCTYDGVNCGLDDFDVVRNHHYGNCFVFNQKHSSRNVARNTSKTGMQWGLKLTLFLETDEYVGVLSHAPGGRLSLSSSSVFATPEDQGITFAPGEVTSIATRFTQINRRPSPYSNCTTSFPDFPLLDALARNSFAQFNYNVRQCQNMCIVERLLERCKCVDRYFFGTDNSSLTLCDSWSAESRSCREAVYTEAANNALNCNCNQACTDNSYSMVISQSQWPSKNYAPYLLSKMRKGGLGNSDNLKNWANSVVGLDSVETTDTAGTGTADQPADTFEFNIENILSQVQANIARIEIYYEELNYERLTEIPAYTLVQLLSDFGGNIGLWTGVCIFNVFEVVKLLVDGTTLLIRNRLREREKTTDSI